MGSGEPIWLTNIAERAETGIRTGTFENINAVDENGLLLSGRPENMLGITFRNVNMTVATLGNCPVPMAIPTFPTWDVVTTGPLTILLTSTP